MDDPKIKPLSNQAIDAAIVNDWQKAIKLYSKILLIDKLNVDACLGLGFAYLQVNDIKKAKKYYKKAIQIDNANTIAINNLEKIKIIEKKGKKTIKTNSNVTLDPNMFINIIGITKVITLINTGQSHVIAKLKVGEEVFFKIRTRRIEIRNGDQEYIGALPDDISKRLIFFIKSKSKYIVYIKSVYKNSVEVFIKELKKGTKVKKYVSFPKNIQDNLKNMVIVKDEEDIPMDEDDINADADSADKSGDLESDADDSVIDTDIEWLANNEESTEERINQEEDDLEEFEE